MSFEAANEERSVVEIRLVPTAEVWIRRAWPYVLGGAAPRTAHSLLATGYVVASRLEAERIREWATVIPGFYHAPGVRGPADMPALTFDQPVEAVA